MEVEEGKKKKKRGAGGRKKGGKKPNHHQKNQTHKKAKPNKKSFSGVTCSERCRYHLQHNLGPISCSHRSAI